MAIGVNDPGRENGGDFVQMIASVAWFEARRDNACTIWDRSSEELNTIEL